LFIRFDKVRYAVHTCTWTPDGRRLLTGNHHGAFLRLLGFFYSRLSSGWRHVCIVPWSAGVNHGVVCRTDDEPTPRAGEFTLWNGMAFNFETLIAAHSSAVRAMRWSHSGSTLLSADQNGVIKYWQSTMTLVNEIPQTHNGQPVRALDFAPGDSKFVSCSDDGTIRIWDWELFKVRSIRTFFLDSCLLLL
jgi:WD40 repeat protein